MSRLMEGGSAALMALVLSVLPAASVTMYVHDSSGVLGTVDTDTGSVDVIGSMGAVMTDIAFDPSGNLFGITFNGLYSINRATAASAFIGSHSVPGGNALVFGSDGTLYSAGFSSTSLFTIDPSTGASTNLGNTGFASGGDLAFVGSDFYLADSSSNLISINLSDLSNSSVVGAFGIGNVFGIATSEGNMFGVAGTQIFSVDVTTGAGFDVVDYGGQGLGSANGQSFFAESGAPEPNPIPLPATALMLLSGISMAGFICWSRRRNPPAA
jgi:hypothetical protein